MPTPPDQLGGETWDAAPCGLLRLDSAGLITATNPSMLERTGYDPASLVGQLHWDDLMAPGSRLFYQTQLAPVLELEGALNEVMIDLLARDGSRVPALMNAVRLTDSDGRTCAVQIAVMSVPDRRAYETELRYAREQALQASAADAQARRRLELLAQASTALASSSDVSTALARMARLIVAELADWCLIYSSDPAESEQTLQWAAAHTDPSCQASLDRLAELLPIHADPTSAFDQALARAEPILLAEVSPEHLQESGDSPEVCKLYPIVGLSSAIVVPSTARGERVATLIVVRGADRTPFNDDDLSLLTDLAARTGMVLDNVRRQHREHGNSMALQQALLTVPRTTERVEIGTRYLPATMGNEIGGDWYDAFLQPDGSQIVVIGDVVGHDIRAAAAMGQLRAVIRTIGYTDAGTPAAILQRTDETTRALGVDVLATAFIGRILTCDAGTTTLQWANAGHPPPVVIDQRGRIRLLDTPPDRPLGIRSMRARHDYSVTLGTGDTVLLYTDGLIERTDEDVDAGIGRLADAVTQTESWSLEEICDWVLAGHRSTRRDDIALLAFRLI